MRNQFRVLLNAATVSLFLTVALLLATTVATAQKQTTRTDTRRLTMEPATGKTRTSTQTQTDLTTGPKPRLVVQLGHNEPIDSAAFSPDGQYVVTGSFIEEMAIVWEVRRGLEIRRFMGNKHKGGQDGYMAVAFSPDATRIAATSESGARIFDIASGKLVRHFPIDSPEEIITTVFFSADGTKLSSHGYTWDIASGKLIRKVSSEQAKAEMPKSFVTPDGRLKAEAMLDPKFDSKKDDYLYKDAVIKEARSGSEIRRLTGHSDTITALALSPDGSLLVTGANYGDKTIRVWDTDSGQEIGRLQGYATTGITRLTEEGIFTSTNQNLAVVLRENLSGQEQVFGDRNLSGKIVSSLFSANRRVAGISMEKAIFFVDTATGKPLLQTLNRDARMLIAAISPDGTYAAIDIEGKGGDWKTQIWDLKKKQATVSISRYANGTPIAFSGSDLVATQMYGKASAQEIVLLSPATGNTIRTIPLASDNASCLAFSPDGLSLAATSTGASSIADPTFTQVWRVADGTEVRRLQGHPTSIHAVTWSPDGTLLATGGQDATVRLWEVNSGRELRQMRGHAASVRRLEFSADSRFILSLSDDNTERLCRVADGSLLARLVNLTNGDWVVIDNEGRFDTNNLDSIRGLHWVMPDDPLKPLPLEIFMRSYYEPRLLARLMAGEKLRSVQNIFRLNRAQPDVRITKITPQTEPDRVTITVEVSNTNAAFKRDGRMVKADSGVYDLRLFRDGQLVAYAPEQDGAVTLNASGKAVFNFKNIRLPDYASLRNVEFSAYAFNADRVKSNTSRMPYLASNDLPVVKGRAYVITIGVNAYENVALNLQFAANDAHRLQGLLAQRLKAAGSFDDFVGVSLIADYELQLDGRAISSDAASIEEKKNGKSVVTASAATKANVRLLLDALSGRNVDRAQLAAIPGAEKIQAARPQDLVIISFAGHGYADSSGSFYLVPFDIGPGNKREVTPAMLQRCISSEELSHWLRDVDAGEMIMIIDACQSAAAVEGNDFKPGPMGSRGLGQLSYDKGMRILTATQSDNVALENKLTRQGLLTYALVHDGIEMQRADFKPQDKVVTMSEWLAYGVWRVPELYVEIKSGQINQTAGVTTQTRLIVVDSSQPETMRLLKHDNTAAASKKNSMESQTQQPSLFDFSRKKRDVMLLKK